MDRSSLKRPVASVVAILGLLGLWCSALCLVSGCAATPSYSQYADNEIDRTTTLPSGVVRYTLLYGQGLGSPAQPFVYPLSWEQGLSPRLTVIYMPLPLELRWLASKSESGWTSVGAAFLGPIRSRNKNFDWRPTLQSRTRWRINGDWAVDVDALVLMEITRDAYGNPGSTTGIRAGGIRRVTPWASISWGFWVQREQGTTRAQYVGSLPAENEGQASAGAVRWRFPINLEARTTIARQWEIALSVDDFRWGYRPESRTQSVYATLQHTW